MTEATEAQLIGHLVNAAEALEGELAQEGARDLRPEEVEQVKRIAEELDLLTLAVVYDEA